MAATAPFPLPPMTIRSASSSSATRMIWSAGYDRGPGPVSTAGGTGGTYDLYWLNTSDIVAYYKAKAGLS